MRTKIGIKNRFGRDKVRILVLDQLQVSSLCSELIHGLSRGLVGL